MSNKSGIYSITHIESGRQYIGSTADFKKRWYDHRYNLARGSHRSIQLQRAWNKYGAEAFTFAVIEVVENAAYLIEREQYWLEHCRPYYNTCRQAGSVRGIKHGQEYKERARKTLLALWQDPEYRMHISALRSEKAQDPDFIARQSAASKAHSQTPEGRAQRSAAAKGKTRTPEQRARYSAAAIARWERQKAGG